MLHLVFCLIFSARAAPLLLTFFYPQLDSRILNSSSTRQLTFPQRSLHYFPTHTLIHHQIPPNQVSCIHISRSITSKASKSSTSPKFWSRASLPLPLLPRAQAQGTSTFTRVELLHLWLNFPSPSRRAVFITYNPI